MVIINDEEEYRKQGETAKTAYCTMLRLISFPVALALSRMNKRINEMHFSIPCDLSIIGVPTIIKLPARNNLP